jgi:stage IV sporulation protein FB
MISIPGRIPIRIFPLFWLLIGMIGWLSSESVQGTLTWGVVILISVLIHEFGHALTALMFGQSAEIDLVGLGGLTRRTGPKMKGWQEFLVVINGPLAGFLLFFVIAYLQSTSIGNQLGIVRYALKVGAYVNLIWNLLNLLPVQPLDGGHLVRVVLESLLGLKGTKISFLISVVFACALSLFFFLTQSFIAGSLFLMLAFDSYRAWSELKTVTSQDTSDHLQELMKEAELDLKAGREKEAFSKLTSLREQAKEGILFVISTQYLSRLLAQQGQFNQAYEWLLPLEKRLDAEYLNLLQQLAYRLQKWTEVARIGTRAYQAQPLAHTALLNALSYAIRGYSKESVGWLTSSMQNGLPNVSQVIQKREFDSIRETPQFQNFLNRFNLNSP